MINFKKGIIILSVGISSIQNIAFASVEYFTEGWFFGSLDAICTNYQFGDVSEKLAKEHFEMMFKLIDDDDELSKEAKDRLYGYTYSDSENDKDCEKFLPY